MSNQLFVNIENEKIYKLVDFARRKDPESGWSTEIAFQPEGSQQIYIRKVSDFFSKFIPKNCWDTATEKQKKEMKEKLKVDERPDSFAAVKTVYPEGKREYIDLKDYVHTPHLICHRHLGEPKMIYTITCGDPAVAFDVRWTGGVSRPFNLDGTENGEHQFYLNPVYKETINPNLILDE